MAVSDGIRGLTRGDGHSLSVSRAPGRLPAGPGDPHAAWRWSFEPPFSLLWQIQRIVLAPGERIPPRPHHDAELITLVLSGEVLHEDSLGNHVRNGPGTVQLLSAGNGVVHSDLNSSQSEPATLLRLWLQPRLCLFLAADYHRLIVPPGFGALTLASPDAPPGSAATREDFALLMVRLQPGSSLRHPLATHGGGPRRAYGYALHGSAELAGAPLYAGQGRTCEPCQSTLVTTREGVQLLLLDLP